MTPKKLQKILITGAAGFIGFHLTKKLLEKNVLLLGIDSLNDYYSPKLKKDRLLELKRNHNNHRLTFLKGNINNQKILQEIENFKPEIIIHLAAQAGVRYSIENPGSYIDNNIKATLKLFELCKKNDKLRHFIYASTSSVYGLSENYPLSEDQSANHPLQFYAVTKKATELMAHSYAALYNIPSTGLRFFTVYGPWGRPDMALFKFTKNILQDKPIDVYGHGKHVRDFTYVDDIVNGIMKVMNKPPKKNLHFNKQKSSSQSSAHSYRILNIGGGAPINLMEYIKAIEFNLGKKAKIRFLPLQPGDILKTESDTSRIEKFGFKAKTDINLGVQKFVNWYLQYYK